MKIDLVFYDWIKKGGKSVYSTIEGIHLSTGDFHSGSTFAGQILLDSEQEAELLQALDEGYEPVFWIMKGKYMPNLFKKDHWISMQFGFERSNFYIKHAGENIIICGNPAWPSDADTHHLYEEFLSHNPILLGPAKKRWWWKFLPPGIRLVVCPYVLFK